MKFRAWISGAVICVLLVSIMTYAGASVFPDVLQKHSWAEEAINDMVSRSILKGFPDGSFRPDNGITKLDALIIAARIAGVNLPENNEYADAAAGAYAKALDIYDIEYKKEVTYLLYKGILSESELPSYIGDGVKTNPLKRHEAAILLTKMMNGVKEANSSASYSVSFADINDIPAASLAYVNYVNENGIMNGMEDNMFMPYYEVTRAMMATMMHRAEQAVSTDMVECLVTSVSPTNRTVTGTVDGEATTLEIPEDALIRIDGSAADIVSCVPGITLRIEMYGDEIAFVEGLAGSVQYATAGTVQTTGTNNGIQMISITPAGKSESETYPLAEKCSLKVDNSSVAFSGIKIGMYVKIEVKGGKVTSVTAETKSYEYKGTVSKVSVGEAVVISVKLTDGTNSDFTLAEGAVVKRNGADIDPWLLCEGDSVVMSVKSGAVNVLTATSQNTNTEGTITAINISSTPTITMTVGGADKTYNVNSETLFVIDDNNEGTIYDLRLGASATVKLESNTISKITTAKLVMSNVLVGTVSYIHPTSYVMGIDVADSSGKISTIQAVVKSTVKITDTTASAITKFKGLTTGRSVVAVGSVNYGVYEINSITITN